MVEQDKYLTTSQLMEYLEISRSTIYRLLANGMPNIMVERIHRFPREQVLSWLKENYGDSV